ncbi:hypothetical protein ELG69_16320 [Rhizobium leguminosarum]|uniref:hypothetical protein n=1 Tax=Rhizobium leguminosarum TaxID=384 RepID=UPI0010319963|nr:hypothetical protein [Rhizobium leguminosarum]TBG85555.1 hypothetical protein ELG69_16320 [Rhizobium leguminosarum]
MFMLRDEFGLGRRQLMVSHRLGFQTEMPNGELFVWYADGDQFTMPSAEAILAADGLEEAQQLASGALSKVAIFLRSPSLSFAFSCWREHEEIAAEPRRRTRALFQGSSVRRVVFDGWLTIEGQTKTAVSGIAYLQEVYLSGLLFPWNWHYVTLADGSVLGASVVRFGANALSFAPNRPIWLSEALSLPLLSRGYWIDGQTGKMLRFQKASIHLAQNLVGEIVGARVQVSDREGNFVSWLSETRNAVRTRLRNGRRAYNYAAHLGQVTELNGSIHGNRLNLHDRKSGFTNFEYTSGLL